MRALTRVKDVHLKFWIMLHTRFSKRPLHFFGDAFCVVCGNSKRVQTSSGANIDTLQGVVSVMCKQLCFFVENVLRGGREACSEVDVASNPIKGSRALVLQTLEDDIQLRFSRKSWGGEEAVSSRVEASSNACERVFSYITATDFGQLTQKMCEAPWIRCNGAAPECWCLHQFFDAVHDAHFKPQKRKQSNVVELEDGTLMGFGACKDLVILARGSTADVAPVDVQVLWVVP